MEKFGFDRIGIYFASGTTLPLLVVDGPAIHRRVSGLCWSYSVDGGITPSPEISINSRTAAQYYGAVANLRKLLPSKYYFGDGLVGVTRSRRTVAINIFDDQPTLVTGVLASSFCRIRQRQSLFDSDAINRFFDADFAQFC